MQPRAKIYKRGYIVTDDGKVFNMRYNGLQRWRLMKPYNNPKERCGGYFYVLINGRREAVHRIVAECFCEKPPGEAEVEVNHKDGNKLNNHFSNLEWVTHLENVRHAYRTGLITGAQIVLNARHPHPTRRTIARDTARDIKELIWDGVPDSLIAKALCIKAGVVHCIRKDATYKDVPWPERERSQKLGTEAAVRAVAEYMGHRKENQ